MAVPQLNSIVVAGGGAWGTALASLSARAGLATTLWCRSAEQAAHMRDTGENAAYLPGYRLPDGLQVASDATVFEHAGAIILATPAQSTRAMAALIAGHCRTGVPVILAAKGLERGSDKLLSDVLAEAAPELIPMVLSGPSFAVDVVAGKPTAVTLAGHDTGLTHAIAAAIGGPLFRVYVSDDLIGVQVGGAVKNVIAIAAGICAGNELGASALAALTTRSFAELRRLAAQLGAQPDTMFGLSGLGDLILTCSSPQSRNFSLGIELGRGVPLADILSARRAVSEGVYTASVVAGLALRHDIDMPVCEAVCRIVTGAGDVDGEINRLLARPFRAETE